MKNKKEKINPRQSELENKKNSSKSELLTIEIPRGVRVSTFRFNNTIKTFHC